MTGLALEVAWKTTFVAMATLILLALTRPRSAAEKALIARWGLIAILLTPAAIVLAPPLHVAMPESMPTVFELGRIGFPGTGHGSWVTWLYLIPAVPLAVERVISLIRLAVLRSHAQVLVDTRWLSALAVAQRDAGSKHGAALLESEALRSPVSWGFLRPTIMLNADRPTSADHATFVVTHELSHILRVDWLTMLIAKTVTTLFWFNPLVWWLARENHQLCEEAADDAVLIHRRGSRADYASLLVQTARNHLRTPTAMAHPIAPAGGALRRRVEGVLAEDRRRAPPPRWAFAPALALVVVLTGCLGAFQPTAPAGWAAADSPTRTADEASASLLRMTHPQARALGRALSSSSWPARRIRGVSTFYEAGAMDALVQASEDGRPVNRRIAVWGLSEIDPQRAANDEAWSASIAALQARVQDRSPAVRGLAARALANFGHMESAASLMRMLKDSDPSVRAEAAHAVGDLQLPEAIEPLRSMLDDPDPMVRNKAAWALARCREAQIVSERSTRPAPSPT